MGLPCFIKDNLPPMWLQLVNHLCAQGVDCGDCVERESCFFFTEVAIQRRHLVAMEIAGGSGHTTGHSEIEIERSPMFFPYEFSIYRVPTQLRHINEAAYTPQVVSIGPFHHGKTELKTIEAQKTIYLKTFLQWTEVDWQQLFTFVEERETRLRNCYAEPIGVSEGFLKMILLDTVFIISILLKSSFGDYLSEADGIWTKPWMIQYIRYDMCLIENQLPFFIVDELLEFSGVLLHFGNLSTIQLVHKFLKDAWRSWVSDYMLEKVSASNYKIEHFVDYLRLCQKPSAEERLNDPVLTTATAFELHQAGVQFCPVQPDEAHPWKLFDLKFNVHTGILEIPRLIITDRTELLLRNIQSFEHCHCNQEDRFFADYIYAMGKLVHADRDFELLIKNDIIKNRIPGNGEVYSLFTDLSKAIPSMTENFYFSDLFQDLNQYSRRRRHRWFASLIQTYFHSPWSIISVVTAGLLLIFTGVQTFVAIFKK